jgi:DNA polymerase-3 subunit delta'
MPIIPLYGHALLRERLDVARRRGSLPQSLLLHGPAGVGKQRLALWLAQTLVCEGANPPCERCRHCRYARELTHPDILWAFPLPHPKSERDIDDAKGDLQRAAQERAKESGLYAAPPGTDGIYVATARMLVMSANLSPALAARKVFIVGDADRMAQQEGNEFAANAFLKLLEEPPRNTFLVLTTSALGSLLPTIRSRVVAIRVPPLGDRDTGAFLDDPTVSAALAKRDLPPSRADRIALAGGAPGRLLSSVETDAASRAAQMLLDAAVSGNRATILRSAFVQGSTKARGGFTDVLEALTGKLHARARHAAQEGDDATALAASRAVDLVEDAKLLAAGNVNPQLVSVRLLTDMSSMLA